MVDEKLEIQSILKGTHLFNRLGNQDLETITEQFHTMQIPRGEAIFHQGDEADTFYVILEGQVKITQQRGNQIFTLATFIPGDYFGEEALMTHRARSATVTALENTSLLYLDKEHFNQLLRTFPQLKLNILMAVQTRQMARGTVLPWLAADEVVYFISRRQIHFLYLAEIGPTILFLGSLILFIYLYFSPMADLILPFLGAAVLAALAVLWGIWNYVDWGNDYFIVTNRRVVWLERVVGMYDSRQEAPLSTILSVGITTSQASRIFGFGNVNIRTYTGTIVFHRVGYPEQVAALVEEQWFRAKASSRKEEALAMERAIRERLGMPVPGVDGAKPGKPSVPKTTYIPGLLQQWFSNVYTMRFEEGNTVTYRKHWFDLLEDTWQPAALILIGVIVFLLRLFNTFDFLSLTTVTILCLLWIVGFLGWYLYEYVDWRNDVYQITPEQIVDVERKPFGKEEKKAAPLENILSIQYERLGIMGQIFNFGSVYVMVGGQKFTFYHVFNPSEVQQDIFRRMADRNAKKKQAEVQAERERVSDWFAAYHHVTEEEDERRRLQLEEDQDDLDFDLDYGNPPGTPRY